VRIKRRKSERDRELEREIEPLKGIIIETNPLLISSEFPSFSYKFDVVQNPMYEPKPEPEPEFDLLKPDEIHDDDTVLELFQTVVKNTGEPLEVLIEQVKGTPLYGSMMKLSDMKRQELSVKLKLPSEVESVISRLRRVNRASLCQASTTVVKLRVHARWHKMAEKILYKNV
jgi:hypothetical protein